MNARPRRRDNARHEAAHALVAWLVEIPLKSCSIREHLMVQDGKRFLSLGHTLETEEENAWINATLFGEGELSGEDRERLERHLFFAMAGYVAEGDMVSTSPEADHSDRRNAMLAAIRLSGGRIIRDGIKARHELPEAQKEGYYSILGTAEYRVREMLEEYGGAWDGLTARLLRDSSLSGEQVDRILNGIIGRPAK